MLLESPGAAPPSTFEAAAAASLKKILIPSRRTSVAKTSRPSRRFFDVLALLSVLQLVYLYLSDTTTRTTLLASDQASSCSITTPGVAATRLSGKKKGGKNQRSSVAASWITRASSSGSAKRPGGTSEDAAAGSDSPEQNAGDEEAGCTIKSAEGSSCTTRNGSTSGSSSAATGPVTALLNRMTASWTLKGTTSTSRSSSSGNLQLRTTDEDDGAAAENESPQDKDEQTNPELQEQKTWSEEEHQGLGYTGDPYGDYFAEQRRTTGFDAARRDSPRGDDDDDEAVSEVATGEQVEELIRDDFLKEEREGEPDDETDSAGAAVSGDLHFGGSGAMVSTSSSKAAEPPKQESMTTTKQFCSKKGFTTGNMTAPAAAAGEKKKGVAGNKTSATAAVQEENEKQEQQLHDTGVVLLQHADADHAGSDTSTQMKVDQLLPGEEGVARGESAIGQPSDGSSPQQPRHKELLVASEGGRKATGSRSHDRQNSTARASTSLLLPTSHQRLVPVPADHMHPLSPAMSAIGGRAVLLGGTTSTRGTTTAAAGGTTPGGQMGRCSTTPALAASPSSSPAAGRTATAGGASPTSAAAAGGTKRWSQHQQLQKPIIQVVETGKPDLYFTSVAALQEELNKQNDQSSFHAPRPLGAVHQTKTGIDKFDARLEVAQELLRPGDGGWEKSQDFILIHEDLKERCDGQGGKEHGDGILNAGGEQMQNQNTHNDLQLIMRKLVSLDDLADELDNIKSGGTTSANPAMMFKGSRSNAANKTGLTTGEDSLGGAEVLGEQRGGLCSFQSLLPRSENIVLRILRFQEPLRVIHVRGKRPSLQNLPPDLRESYLEDLRHQQELFSTGAGGSSLFSTARPSSGHFQHGASTADLTPSSPLIRAAFPNVVRLFSSFLPTYETFSAGGALRTGGQRTSSRGGRTTGGGGGGSISSSSQRDSSRVTTLRWSPNGAVVQMTRGGNVLEEVSGRAQMNRQSFTLTDAEDSFDEEEQTVFGACAAAGGLTTSAGGGPLVHRIPGTFDPAEALEGFELDESSDEIILDELLQTRLKLKPIFKSLEEKIVTTSGSSSTSSGALLGATPAMITSQKFVLPGRSASSSSLHSACSRSPSPSTTSGSCGGRARATRLGGASGATPVVTKTRKMKFTIPREHKLVLLFTAELFPKVSRLVKTKKIFLTERHGRQGEEQKALAASSQMRGSRQYHGRLPGRVAVDNPNAGRELHTYANHSPVDEEELSLVSQKDLPDSAAVKELTEEEQAALIQEAELERCCSDEPEAGGDEIQGERHKVTGDEAEENQDRRREREESGARDHVFYSGAQNEKQHGVNSDTARQADDVGQLREQEQEHNPEADSDDDNLQGFLLEDYLPAGQGGDDEEQVVFQMLEQNSDEEDVGTASKTRNNTGLLLLHEDPQEPETAANTAATTAVDDEAPGKDEESRNRRDSSASNGEEKQAGEGAEGAAVRIANEDVDVVKKSTSCSPDETGEELQEDAVMETAEAASEIEIDEEGDRNMSPRGTSLGEVQASSKIWSEDDAAAGGAQLQNNPDHELPNMDVDSEHQERAPTTPDGRSRQLDTTTATTSSVSSDSSDSIRATLSSTTDVEQIERKRNPRGEHHQVRAIEVEQTSTLTIDLLPRAQLGYFFVEEWQQEKDQVQLLKQLWQQRRSEQLQACVGYFEEGEEEDLVLKKQRHQQVLDGRSEQQHPASVYAFASFREQQDTTSRSGSRGSPQLLHHHLQRDMVGDDELKLLQEQLRNEKAAGGGAPGGANDADDGSFQDGEFELVVQKVFAMPRRSGGEVDPTGLLEAAPSPLSRLAANVAQNVEDRLGPTPTRVLSTVPKLAARMAIPLAKSTLPVAVNVLLPALDEIQKQIPEEHRQRLQQTARAVSETVEHSVIPALHTTVATAQELRAQVRQDGYKSTMKTLLKKGRDRLEADVVPYVINTVTGHHPPVTIYEHEQDDPENQFKVSVEMNECCASSPASAFACSMDTTNSSNFSPACSSSGAPSRAGSKKSSWSGAVAATSDCGVQVSSICEEDRIGGGEHFLRPPTTAHTLTAEAISKNRCSYYGGASSSTSGAGQPRQREDVVPAAPFPYNYTTEASEAAERAASVSAGSVAGEQLYASTPDNSDEASSTSGPPFNNFYRGGPSASTTSLMQQEEEQARPSDEFLQKIVGAAEQESYTQVGRPRAMSDVSTCCSAAGAGAGGAGAMIAPNPLSRTTSVISGSSTAGAGGTSTILPGGGNPRTPSLGGGSTPSNSPPSSPAIPPFLLGGGGGASSVTPINSPGLVGGPAAGAGASVVSARTSPGGVSAIFPPPGALSPPFLFSSTANSSPFPGGTTNLQRTVINEEMKLHQPGRAALKNDVGRSTTRQPHGEVPVDHGLHQQQLLQEKSSDPEDFKLQFTHEQLRAIIVAEECDTVELELVNVKLAELENGAGYTALLVNPQGYIVNVESREE
ncbi:unnamed protein product [Amoebophrya sp. A120]|nr:unnamed protein product [Amoebophrya sp. A120]|eukprot:GSA120T00008741001.1